MLRALRHYSTILSSDLKKVASDPLVGYLLAGDRSSAVELEISNADAIAAVLDAELHKKGPLPVFMQVTRWWVGFVKSICVLYLRLYSTQRDLLSRDPGLSRAVLELLDQQITRLEEKFNSGIFMSVPTMSLSIEQIAISEHVSVQMAPSVPTIPQLSPAPVVLDSIQVLDPDLRSRCLDLFKSFTESSQTSRLDTVLTEATRILEDRIRHVSGAPANSVGVELAQYAFSGEEPRIRLSELPAEQDAARLLFRGFFGFIRNHVHHRLVGDLKPDRVLQIVGMIDYLVSLIDVRRVAAP
jgi:hypothetical protein